jgi:hypothetical protein
MQTSDKSHAYWLDNAFGKIAIYCCPLTPDIQMRNHLGMIKKTNDGRFRWIIFKIKSVPPIGWKNEHLQGVSYTIAGAKLAIEQGFA